MISIFKRIKQDIKALFFTSRLFESEVSELYFEKSKKDRHYHYRKFQKRIFSLTFTSKEDIYQYLSLLFLLFFAFLLPYLSLNVGVSDSEFESVNISKKIYDSQISGEKTIFLQNCGQSIDNLTYIVTKWVGYEESIFTIRHWVSALFGWGIILLLGFILAYLFSWRAAFFGILLLFLSPRFLSNILGNLTDTSFAFFYILFFYQLFLFFKELPKIDIKRILCITLCTTLATTIYANGFFLILYLFLFSFLYFIFHNPIKKIFTFRYFYNISILFLIVFCISLFVYISHYLYLSALTNYTFISPFTSFHSNPINFAQLFDGELITKIDSPLYYITRYFFITTPFVILIGFALFFIIPKTIIKKISFFQFLFLIFLFFYPLLNITKDSGLLFEGISQHLFLYPFLILISTTGFEALLLKIDDKYTNSVLISIIILLFLMPLRHIILYHPMESSYYNEIVGGVPNVYGKYELDIHQRSNQLAWKSFNTILKEEKKKININNEKIVVYSDGNKSLQCFLPKNSNKIELHFCNYNEKYSYDWDYFISFGRGLPAYEYNNDFWPPSSGTIYTLTIEGKPIVAILKNEN